MKWFMLIMLIHISEYNSATPNNIKFIKVDKEYKTMEECVDDQPHQTIQQIKKYKFMYDWRLASCTDGPFTVYMHPSHPNRTKDFIKKGKGVDVNYENKNRSSIRSD